MPSRSTINAIGIALEYEPFLIFHSMDAVYAVDRAAACLDEVQNEYNDPQQFWLMHSWERTVTRVAVEIHRAPCVQWDWARMRACLVRRD